MRKLSESARGFANAAASMWKAPGMEKTSLEYLLALKLGLEKRRDVDQLAAIVRAWDRGGRVGEAFPSCDLSAAAK